MINFLREHLRELAWTILTGIVGWLYKVALSYKGQIKATQQGVVALLRNSIIGLYNNYFELGYLPIYERENLEKMYKEYKALGGNGVIDHLIEELIKLPVTKKKEDKK